MAELTLSQDLIDHQDQLEPNDETTRDLRVQLVFMAFGWLSMLYDPHPKPNPQSLQICQYTRVLQQATKLKTEVLHNFEQDFNQLQQPLTNLFFAFGNFLPPFDSHLYTDSSASNNTLRHIDHSEYLILSFLSYRTLVKVAKIKIQWVDSLNLHLEFDEGARVLKLFRFPSFCRLMYHEDGESRFLDR